MTREEQIWDEACHRYADSKMRNAFVAAANWADSHHQWIPVEERLPHENQRVLVYNGIFNEVHLCDYYDGKFEDYYGLFRKGVATHWMPLPAAPRKEENK